MGTVIRFEPRAEAATRKTEEILTRIGDLYQQRLKAEAQLPAALARLVREGRGAEALEALILWGEERMEPHRILARIEPDRSGSE
jgi:hypothetical protein